MLNITLPKAAEKVIELLNRNGFECYAVGGSVRDLLAGKKTGNFDFTTNAKPEQIQKLFPDSFYDNAFGTVGIALSHLYTQFGMTGAIDEEEIYEITTFRSEEGYQDRRHPDKIVWGDSLYEDLKRRDFTINAMAMTIESQSFDKTQDDPEQSRTGQKLKIKSQNLTINNKYILIDVYDGQKDLQAKIIRAVGNPNERFGEDALRMMRAIRFAAEMGFDIEKETLRAILENSGLLVHISRERIRDELLKILKSPFPYEGMMFLHNTKLLSLILPEIEACLTVPQKSPNRHHIYDVGTHSLLAMKNCPSIDPIVRLATLLHDTGKAKTFHKLADGTITFYNHEVVSARLANNIAERLRLSNEQKQTLWTLIRWHQFSVDEHQTDAAIRRFIKRVGVCNIEKMIDLRIGDRLGGGLQTATSWRLQLYMKRIIDVQKHTPSVHDLKVNGNDVMKILEIKPGPKIGEILDKLFKEITNDPKKNERELLLKMIIKLGHGL